LQEASPERAEAGICFDRLHLKMLNPARAGEKI